MAGDLKRLGFIPATAEFLYSKTLDAYGATKTLTPLFLQDQLLKPVESKVAELASPVAASVQTGSLSLLATLDSKVNWRRGPRTLSCALQVFYRQVGLVACSPTLAFVRVSVLRPWRLRETTVLL